MVSGLVTALPRLVIAAPTTGQGKTTVATGLMAALRRAGHEVSGHKVGPDYIDPGYHSLATGRAGRNLDPHLVGEERIVPLLLHGASAPAPADIAIIEGVMGLHDGQIGTDGFSSTAHVAKLTSSPVVLVIDVARMSRSAGAIAAGIATFDPDISVAGVVLNRIGSARNEHEIRRSMERVGLPVLGALPRDEAFVTPSRHLGLLPAAERSDAEELVDRLGQAVAEHLDLTVLLDVARDAPELTGAAWQPGEQVHSSGDEAPVIAVAGGQAFTFHYAETAELLTAAGCQLVPFDPLLDPHLPTGTRAIYLGGGFPEVHAAELAANTSLMADVRSAVAQGVPTVAECAGLLYLADTLDGMGMAGAVPADAAMSTRLTLRYPMAVAASDSLLTRSGEQVTGHEFHRTATTPGHGINPAWEIDGEPIGFTGETWHASYLHVHWAGHPHLAQRFADAAHRAEAFTPSALAESADPLLHHGDAEAAPGLLDFAVNVYSGDRPAWLSRALHDAVDDSHSYPDAAPARRAIAALHGRATSEVLPTSGAAEAFTLIAGMRRWKRPVVVHPQFTEPHAALERVGCAVTTVLCVPANGFAFDPDAVPDDADLVVIGNPTNPTGVLHPADHIRMLQRPGRIIVVDEAFMDAVGDEKQSLSSTVLDGVIVIRSLTKHWSMPGIRAGYVVGDRSLIADLTRQQTPWSVSTPAIAAMKVCAGRTAMVEAQERAATIAVWRDCLQAGLADRGIKFVPSAASFVLAQVGEGVHGALRAEGVAVRRADTFPGLDPSWVRIAVREEDLTDRLLAALDLVR